MNKTNNSDQKNIRNTIFSLLKIGQNALPSHILYLFLVYAFGMVLFTVFRTILVIAASDKIATIPADRMMMLAKAMFMGFRFDTVISGYILILPALLMPIASFIPAKSMSKRAVFNVFFVFTSALYSFAFLICSVDIPYFVYFFARLSTTILIWIEDIGFGLKIITQEPTYVLYGIPLVIICGGFIWVNNRIKNFVLKISFFKNNDKIQTAPDGTMTVKKGPQPRKSVEYTKLAVYSLLTLVVLFVGVRGRIEHKSPIRIGTAYFSDNAFVNQIGLNPVFTFLKSWLNDRKPENKVLHLMDNQEAIALVRTQLNILDSVNGENFSTPIARRVIPSSNSALTKNNKEAKLPNVVMIIMEAMSYDKLSRNGNTRIATPNLDALAEKSLNFENIYSGGIHTYNGIYSTLYSYPALLKQHPLKAVSMMDYNGIVQSLRDNGYQTIYFTTHDENFDNAGGFLRANGFERVVSQKDYPPHKILSTLGVSDDYILDFSIKELNKLHAKGKPFFSALRTAADHGPFIIPEGTYPKNFQTGNMKVDIVGYADWTIGKFLSDVEKLPWFDNTIFVFTADHGANMNAVYDMPVAYNHIPLMFFSAEQSGIIQKLSSKTVGQTNSNNDEGTNSSEGLKANSLSKLNPLSGMGGQIDIMPTIMGLLGIEYVNTSMGIDLLRETRPYIYFTADDRIGCIGQEYFLVINTTEHREALYRYRTKDTHNYLEEEPALVDSMRQYAYANLQMSQWLISNGKVGVER